MTYIDGFLAAVPVDNREAFIKHANEMAVMFREHGALKIVESWGNDVPDGKLTSFSMAVKKQDNETVTFSWVVWPSKAVRDEAWTKMMSDPRMQPGVFEMPFDGKRLIYGGFEVIVDV